MYINLFFTVSLQLVTAATSLPSHVVLDDTVQTPASLGRLMTEGVQGEPTSAAKVADYFRYGKNDEKQAKYWILIAAENGDAGSQFDEYNVLITSDKKYDQLRAFYWLKKSAQGGFHGALDELKECFPSGKFLPHNSDCRGPSNQQ